MEKSEIIPENKINEDINLSSKNNNEKQNTILSKNIINNPSSSQIFNNNMKSITAIL